MPHPLKINRIVITSDDPHLVHIFRKHKVEHRLIRHIQISALASDGIGHYVSDKRLDMVFIDVGETTTEAKVVKFKDWKELEEKVSIIYTK